MAYNTPESVADYLSRFQMQVTERTKGTFSPMHVKYSLALKMGSSSFETTFQSNPNVHGEPTVTQVFGALASDAMLARDYGMDEFADEFCADMKPSEAIRAYNSCKDALLRNTRKRKGRSLTISPPANGVCILSTPESVTVSMVA